MDKKLTETLNDVLDTTGDGWAMARVLHEHAHSTTAGQAGQGLSDREFLTIKLVAKFSNQVTQKVLRIIFGIHFGQAGQIVKRLQELDLLKETGRGEPLELTKNGAMKIQELQRIKMSQFGLLMAGLEYEDLVNLKRIMAEIDKTATRLVDERIFGKPASN
jgi:hypothetical protein